MNNTLSRKPGLPRVSAVILAAGSSSRMGTAKQLLPLGKSTMLTRTIDNVRRSAVDEIILVLGASAETIRQQLPPPLEKVVVNQAYAQGMASSLRAGLLAVDEQSSAALIILGDQPFIRPQTLDRILAEYRRSSAPIVIPTYLGNRGNPILLDRSLFSEAMALQRDVGCRAIFGNHLDGILKVEVEDQGVLVDIDDPDDYQQVLARE